MARPNVRAVANARFWLAPWRVSELKSIALRETHGLRGVLSYTRRRATAGEGEVVWDSPVSENAKASKLTLVVQAITWTDRSNVQSEIPGEFSFPDCW